MRRPAEILLLGLFGLAACAVVPDADRDFGVSAGLSALPNFGLAASAFQVFRGDEVTEDALELQTHFQFLDDEALHDDGHDAAGDFTQVQLGWRRSWTRALRRRWVARGGAVWFRAEGKPNIVQEEGDYIGVYGGLGFTKQLTPSLSMGPDLTLMVVSRERSGDVDIVPQLAWRVTWRF